MAEVERTLVILMTSIDVVVAVLGDQPHRVAGDRVVHGRGPDAEVVEVVLEDVQGGWDTPLARSALLTETTWTWFAAADAEHVQREDEGVVVVAEVAGVVGVVAGLRSC